MYFLVQANVYLDPDHYRIFDALEELNIDYHVINIPPTAQKIDFETDRKDVFVYGSVTIARLAKQNTDWFPGSFYGGNHLYEVYSKYYCENLLNHKVSVHKISEELIWEKDELKFIKPYNEAKILLEKSSMKRNGKILLLKHCKIKPTELQKILWFRFLKQNERSKKQDFGLLADRLSMPDIINSMIMFLLRKKFQKTD
ncbi:hypothetical protein SAMN05216273_10660 [Chryseobacterium taihuense]|uniref:Uncharacterized protein n=1 Tax=Chryseobacterium taihuense TaxID=1141221 RepID=A0ABY0QST1_9FLAO|nr:hypothetical protein SAMN05216273_10660 [Chryseobacterium taihuense]